MKLPGGILLGVLLAGFLSARAEAVTVQGTLLYEKFPATPQGLDLAHPVEATVPPVSLELRTPDLKTVVAQSSTDENGNYRFDLPDQTRQATLVIWAQSRKLEVRNPETGGLWGALYGPLDVTNWPARIVATDRYRTAGPFNIVAAIHRANRLLAQSDLALLLEEFPVTVFWSPTSERTGQQGNEILLSGQRDSNSDEYDDSVILATYGAYLLNHFLPYSGPAGAWSFTERLDPRLAWKAGWQLFFAQAVIGRPVYIDSRGPDGKDTFVLDLEPDQLEGDTPGFWSAYSVASALWDIAAEKNGDGTHLGLGLGPIWRVLREEFPHQAFPYLITMADDLVQENPIWRDGITDVLARRRIEYHSGAEPPVPVPFPRVIASGVPVTGSVESSSTRRTNLLDSADYYLVRKESDQPLHLRATLSGAPGGTPDVELVLFNEQGAPIKDTNTLLFAADSQAELTLSLPPGRYIIGVLSYVTDRSLQSLLAFGGGQYQLTADY